MKFLYSLAFLLGADNWKLEHLPVEISQALKEFDRVNTKILDLGCGEGRECIALAADGWDVIGVDFIPLAIRRANNAARKAQVLDRTAFYTGDVSRLDLLDLPPIQLAYDIGCFHLLDSEQVEGFISGLSDIVVPGEDPADPTCEHLRRFWIKFDHYDLWLRIGAGCAGVV